MIIIQYDMKYFARKNFDFCKIIEYLGTCSYYKLVIINNINSV